MLRLALTLLALAVPALAQRTWTVDGDNRPGTDFTDLPAAVAAAAPGDTLLVRRCSLPYSPFATGKGLRILAKPDTLIWTGFATPSIRISGLPANQTLQLQGLRGTPDHPLQVELQGNAGLVVLSQVRGLEPCSCGPGVQLPTGFSIVDCAQVVLDECENFGKPAVACVRSRVVMTGCRFGITSLGLGLGDCLHVTDGAVDVVDCQLDGSMGMDGLGNPLPAVRLRAGLLRIAATDDAFVQGSYVSGRTLAQPAIDGTGGHLVLDTDVRLNPQAGGAIPLRLSGASLTLRQVPAVIVRRAVVGGELRAELVTNQGAPALLMLDLPRPPREIPTAGVSWLHPDTALVLAASVTPATGAIEVTIPLPSGLPTDILLCLQGVTDMGAGLELSTPAIFPLR